MSSKKEARKIKDMTEKAKPQDKPVEKPKEPAKPDYGKLREILIERTISVRQYEPLRVQLVYTVGKDDTLETTLGQVAVFNDLMDGIFHKEAPAQQPQQPILEKPTVAPTPEARQQTRFTKASAYAGQSQAPANGKVFRMPSQMEGESDGEYTSRLIKRCYAIWHNELHEREDMHPKVLGVKDKGTALEYIKEYSYKGG